MIEFRYTKHAYYAGVINNFLGLRTLAKFDSGAAVSIIGIERFGIEFQEQQFLDFFTRYARNNGIVKRVYSVANGQEIETYPCVMDRLSLDGTDIRNFRFGFVISRKSNRFLLGDDFISCCDFNHAIGSSINICKFSHSRYAESAESARSAYINQVVDMYKHEYETCFSHERN